MVSLPLSLEALVTIFLDHFRPCFAQTEVRQSSPGSPAAPVSASIGSGLFPFRHARYIAVHIFI